MTDKSTPVQNRPVTILVVGAGSRGYGYAQYAQQCPEQMRVVAVAEPREFYRRRMAETFGIPAENVFTDWREAAARPRLADAVIIATQDKLHTEPTLFFSGLGYRIMLEKPMAPSAEECRKIVAAVKRAGIIFAVCHVLRYTAVTQKIKAVIASGEIGDVISVQHLEPVGYWHQAHSFVRGNWRNERESAPMLLAKSCHDLDWLRHIVGHSCRRVSSFGGLKHFRASERPAGAADRCLDCQVEKNCPYSACKIYLGRIRQGQKEWPTNVLTTDLSIEGVTQALRDGPYGRCVYACDNDVVDHQVVNLEFDGGRTACFSMNAFNVGGGRVTRIFGSRGEIRVDNERIKIFDFLNDTERDVDLQVSDPGLLGGHGGGDGGLMRAFIAAVAQNNPELILSGPDETLESHLMVFAAEQARHEKRVVEVG